MIFAKIRKIFFPPSIIQKDILFRRGNVMSFSLALYYEVSTHYFFMGKEGQTDFIMRKNL